MATIARPLSTPLPPFHKIRAALNSNAAAQLLCDACGAGPCDGGCLIVAKALQYAFASGAIIHLESPVLGGQIEHYGLVLPHGTVLDGEGIFADDLSWARAYESTWRRGPLIVGFGVPGHSEVPDDPRASRELASILLRGI